MPPRWILVVSVLTSACAATAPRMPSYESPSLPASYEMRRETPSDEASTATPSLDSPSSVPDLEPLQYPSNGPQSGPPYKSPYLAQGWIGVSRLDSDDYHGDVELPVLGGAFQQALGGSENLKVGFEAGLSFEWDGDITSVHSRGGGLVVTAENDLLICDFFVGPYGDIRLGERWRIYAAAGGTLEYAHDDARVDDANPGTFHSARDGWGTGLYARTGLEYLIGGGTAVGVGVRYIDSSVDFDGALGDFDFERTQYLFTVTTGF